MPGRQRSRLSRADWVEAAATTWRNGGLAAVAVEPLAAHLGATKGSFYWHFRSREDLVTAVLVQWEQRETDEVTSALSASSDPATRLRLLAERSLDGTVPVDLSVVLLPDAASPLVAATLQRVTRRRLDYLTEQLSALGLEEHEARAQSLLAYCAFLGYSQLRHHLPDTTEDTGEAAYLAALEHALLPR